MTEPFKVPAYAVMDAAPYGRVVRAVDVSRLCREEEADALDAMRAMLWELFERPDIDTACRHWAKMRLAARFPEAAPQYDDHVCHGKTTLHGDPTLQPGKQGNCPHCNPTTPKGLADKIHREVERSILGEPGERKCPNGCDICALGGDCRVTSATNRFPAPNPERMGNIDMYRHDPTAPAQFVCVKGCGYAGLEANRCKNCPDVAASEPVKCEWCGKSFAGEAALSFHSCSHLTHQPSAEPHEVLGTCNLCGYLDVPLDARYCPKCGKPRAAPPSEAPGGQTPMCKHGNVGGCAWCALIEAKPIVAPCTACGCERCQVKDAFVRALATSFSLSFGGQPVFFKDAVFNAANKVVDK